VTELLAFFESLPPGPLYAVIALLAAVENIFPPVPADTAVALGAFFAGRGVLNPWAVFGATWVANVGSAAAVYALARRYGRDFFRGRLGRRLLSERTLERIGREYERHGAIGIFLTRLLPVWRGVVPPFAGIAGVPAHRALVPIALASGVYYGTLTFVISRLGHDLEKVLEVVENLNVVLAVVAAALLAVMVYVFRRRR
jgi:membrane protein DedA with SNARE-associated domain